MAAFLVPPLLVSEADSDNESSSTCDEDSYASTPHDELTSTDSDIDSGIEPVVIKFTPRVKNIANQKEVDGCHKNDKEWEKYDYDKAGMGPGDLEWSLYILKNWSDERDAEGKRYEVLKAGIQCLNVSRLWEADIHVDLKMVNSCDKELTTTLDEHFDWENRHVVTSLGVWKMLINPEYGCVDDEGRFTIECNITFRRLTGVRLPKRFDFSSPSSFSDIILDIRGRQLHVSKQALAIASPVFEALFFSEWKEKDSDAIIIKKVGFKDFVAFLTQIYAPDTPITARNVESLLALADRYATEAVTRMAEQFLMTTNFSDNEFSLAQQLLMADKFRLVRLQNWCIREVSSMGTLKKIMHAVEYKNLSDKMKVALLENVVTKSKEYSDA